MIARDSFVKSWPRLRVGGALLVLDRRPLAMPRHSSPPLTSSRNRSCTRVSSVSSGWNDATRNRPSRSSTGSPSRSASTSTSGPASRDARRADEDARERLVVALEPKLRLEARDLPAVCVAVDLDVDEAEMRPVEQDHPGAGAEHGAVEAADRVLEPVEAHEPRDRGRLAARDDQPVEPVELLRAAAPRPAPRRAGAARPRARGSSPAGPGRRSSRREFYGATNAAPSRRRHARSLVRAS